MSTFILHFGGQLTSAFEIHAAMLARERAGGSYPDGDALEAMEEPLHRLTSAAVPFSDVTAESSPGPELRMRGLSFLAESISLHIGDMVTGLVLMDLIQANTEHLSDQEGGKPDGWRIPDFVPDDERRAVRGRRPSPGRRGCCVLRPGGRAGGPARDLLLDHYVIIERIRQ